MQIYDRERSDNYERRANGAMPGREGLYRLCRASFLGLCETARVLVVGCGTGEEILGLARQFPRMTLTGIDPSEAMLDLCRERVAAGGIAERVALYATDLAHSMWQIGRLDFMCMLALSGLWVAWRHASSPRLDSPDVAV